MSSFLCFICHNTVNCDTNEGIRDKYRDIVGINLCLDSHLCYICCHILHKLWVFKSICYKRSLEYPVLFSEKGTPNLQINEAKTHIICSEEFCVHNDETQLRYNYNDKDTQSSNSNDYVKLEDDFNENKDFNSERIVKDTNNDEPVNDNDNFNDYVNNFNFNCGEVDDVNEEDVEHFSDFKEECHESENDFGEDKRSGEENVLELDIPKKKIKSKRSKKKDFEKITLSKEEQKTMLEKQRRSKKYLEAEFKCYNCALGFLFKDTYQAHMMRHEESNGEYQCLTCTLRFATPALLRSHIVLHAERYKCSQCEEYINARQRQTHARKCLKKTGDAASCHLCGRVFQDPRGLQQHLKRFHMTKTSNRTYSCNVCGNNYNNQAAVRRHMLSKHIHRKFKCDECEATFSSPYNLTQHKKKHSVTEENTEHYCVTCGIGYTSRKSLLAHKRTAIAHQMQEFVCPLCSKSCPNDRALSSHIANVHSGTKNFCCTTCNARYTNRKSLVRHIRSHTVPSQPKMAVCHLCGNSFKGKSKLNRHIKEVCQKDKLEEELSAYYEHNPL